MGTVTQEKWDKTRAMVKELEEMLGAPEEIPLARLLSIRGYLNYVIRTYPWMTPYLQGLHLTIDGWRPDRDEHGHKLQGRALAEWREKRAGAGRWLVGLGDVQREASMLGRREDTEDSLKAVVSRLVEDGGAPKTVRAATRLERDVAALKTLTDNARPARCSF